MTSPAALSPSDEELCRQLASGDGGAFYALYDRYHPRLLPFVAALSDPDGAPDVLHDVLRRVLRQAATLGAQARFAPWVYTLAYQACRQRHRWRPPAPLLRPAGLPSLPGDGPPDAPALRSRLLAALAPLDFAPRARFLLRFQEGFSVEDVAHITGCPLATARADLVHTTDVVATRAAALAVAPTVPAAASRPGRQEQR